MIQKHLHIHNRIAQPFIPFNTRQTENVVLFNGVCWRWCHCRHFSIIFHFYANTFVWCNPHANHKPSYSIGKRMIFYLNYQFSLFQQPTLCLVLCVCVYVSINGMYTACFIKSSMRSFFPGALWKKELFIQSFMFYQRERTRSCFSIWKHEILSRVRIALHFQF